MDKELNPWYKVQQDKIKTPEWLCLQVMIGKRGIKRLFNTIFSLNFTLN